MRPISLLLVDDSPIFLRLVSRFLSEQYPDEVVIAGLAEGGEAGLAQAHALRPDIVLIDLAMPGLPGLKAIPLLRGALPNLGHHRADPDGAQRLPPGGARRGRG